MHHETLARYSLEELKTAPQQELEVSTYGLAIELMLSCALPRNFNAFQPFMIRKDEDGRQYRVFRGIMSIEILGEIPGLTGDDYVSLEIPRAVADAVELLDLSHRIREFAPVSVLGESVLVTLRGKDMPRLQFELGIFFQKRHPHRYASPIGLDTEVFLNPKKFREQGFQVLQT